MGIVTLSKCKIIVSKKGQIKNLYPAPIVRDNPKNFRFLIAIVFVIFAFDKDRNNKAIKRIAKLYDISVTLEIKTWWVNKLFQ